MTDKSIKIELTLDDKDFTVKSTRAGKVLSDLRREIDRTASGADRMEGRVGSFSTKLFQLTTTLSMARGALHNLYDVFLALPASILKTSGEIERLTKLMEGMSEAISVTDRLKDAQKNVEFIFDMARKSPFDVKTLTDAFVKLKSAGIDPTKNSLKPLADAVAYFGGNSEIFHRAAIAIQQMGGKGVISMEELRQQLGEAVPTAMRQLADGMGLTMHELTKKISQGTVAALPALKKMFLQMELQMGGAADRMMNTWVGLTARLHTAWTRFQLKLGDQAFFSRAKALFQDLVASLEDGGFDRLALKLGRAFSSILDVLVRSGQMLAQVWAGALPVLSLAGDMLGVMARAVAPLVDGTNALGLSMNGLTQAMLLVAGAIAVNKLAGWANALGVVKAAKDALATSLKAFSLAQGEAVAAHLLAERIERARASGLSVLVTGNSKLAQVTASLVSAKLAWATAIGTVGRAISGLGSSLLGFVGGPLGAVAMALTFAIMKWREWADEAEEATARVQRLNWGEKGVTLTPAMIAAKQKELANKRFELAETIKILDPAKNKDYAAMSPEVLAAYRSDKSLLEGQIKELERALGASAINDLDNKATEIVRQFRTRWDDIVTRNQAEMNVAVRAFRDNQEKNHAAGDSTRTGTLKLEKSYIDTLLGQLRDEQKRIEALDMPAQARDRALGALAQIQNDYKDKRERVLKDLATPNAFIGEKPTVDPFARALARLKGQVAALKDHTRALLSGTKEFVTDADLLKAAQERIKEEIASGGLRHLDKQTGKLVTPTEEQQRQMAEARAAQAHLQIYNDMLEQTRRKLNELQEAGHNAKEVLQFGEAGRDTSGIRSLTKQFADLQGKLQLTGRELADFNALRQQVFRQQAQNDLDLFAGNLVEKTKEIKTSLIPFDRERREAEYRNEVDLQNRIFQKKLEALRANATSEADFDEQSKLARERYYDYLKQLSERHARDMETPLGKLVREWKDVTKQMGEATARWGQGALDVITNFVKTGKANFKDLLNTILTDIVRTRIAAQFGGVINAGVSALGRAVLGAIGGDSATSVPRLPAGSFEAPSVLSAHGNIVGRFGAVALRRYAAGGIARSPQVSIFGEGSTPEAYVPLPDGRAIPVRLEGAPPAVTVNVVNQSGVPVNATQGQRRFDARQMILDVVLTATATPGPFRDGMKGALV